MRKVLLGLCLAAVPFVAGAGEPPRARQAELLHLLTQDCGSCHGLTLKGGLGPPLLPADLRERDDDALVEAIVAGRPGTPMPPWGFEITEAEAAWLVRAMRKGVENAR
jgi:cytochrome c55X